MNKKMIKLLAAMMVGIMLLGACGGGAAPATPASQAPAASTAPAASQAPAAPAAPAAEKVLTVGTPYTIDTFVPWMSTSDGDRYVFSNVFETIVVNATPEILPCLAESWEVDGLAYVFKIRNNAYWQTGNALFGDEKVQLTAHDIKAVFDFVMDEANGSYHYADAVKYFDAVEATDDFTLRITAKFPSALTLKEISDVPIFPLKAIEAGFDLGSFPVGSGPYKFVEYRTDDRAVLEKNPDYFVEPALDRVIFKIIPDKSVAAIALQNNEVDIVNQINNTDMEAVAAKDFLDLIPNDTGWYRYMGLNVSKDVFKDVKVREAIALAVDWVAITEAIFDNAFGAKLAVPSYGGAVPPEFEGSDLATWESMYEYNPDKAAALLEEAGWAKGSDGIYEKGGVKLAFTIKTPTSDQNRMKFGDMAATYLKSIGINATPQPTEWATMLDDIKNGDTEAFCMGGGSTIGGMNMLFHSQLSSTGSHRTFLDDPELDAMLDEGYSTVDVEKRLEILRAAAVKAIEAKVHAGGYMEYVQIGMNKRVTDFSQKPSFWYGLTTPFRNVGVN